MKITIEELQEYLFDHYKNGGIDQSLFMKLVEEIGEVAEVLNKKAGRYEYLPACYVWWRRGESNSGPRKPPDWHLQAQSLV